MSIQALNSNQNPNQITGPSSVQLSTQQQADSVQGPSPALTSVLSGAKANAQQQAQKTGQSLLSNIGNILKLVARIVVPYQDAIKPALEKAVEWIRKEPLKGALLVALAASLALYLLPLAGAASMAYSAYKNSPALVRALAAAGVVTASNAQAKPQLNPA